MSTKNEAAVSLAKRRWAGTTKAERSAEMAAVSSHRKPLDSAEASRRAASITPEAAAERARKAWETKRRKAAAKKKPKNSARRKSSNAKGKRPKPAGGTK